MILLRAWKLLIAPIHLTLIGVTSLHLVQATGGKPLCIVAFVAICLEGLQVFHKGCQLVIQQSHHSDLSGDAKVQSKPTFLLNQK